MTEADRGIEELLRDRLTERFPAHRVTGEEAGTSGPEGRYEWLLDPIDGTRAFVTGSPLWGILVGLLDDGVPVAGWVNQPYIGETFVGFDGFAELRRGGTTRRLRTKPAASLDEAVLYSTTPAMFDDPERDRVKRLNERVRLVRYGGDCYSYCQLAMGHVDLVVESSLQPYDIAAIIPLIESAGGVVTAVDGGSPAAGGFVVASSGRAIHDAALAVLNE